MKTYSTILKCSLILTVLYFFTACGGNSSTHTGETRVGLAGINTGFNFVGIIALVV